ncbi:hypothetical protein PHLCEN_2v11807 [Hermanssonia centrifuga]|uniref:Uncharacterized protein n=1 Tax=Hermanssonia centrifuga TaxID=98765 RepID=A0A2R6NIZ8_9APHY|nr:hypothetical protein PHLCEN_2v11807 [Hermanssonia centrifuga]
MTRWDMDPKREFEVIKTEDSEWVSSGIIRLEIEERGQGREATTDIGLGLAGTQNSEIDTRDLGRLHEQVFFSFSI